MAFSAEQYRQSVKDNKSTWGLLNDALYRLAREHPGHDSQAVVNAKLWLIGRAYATGIERKIPTKGTQGSSLAQLAEHLLAHSSELEDIFGPLADIAQPLTTDKLRAIVDLHGRFVSLIRPLCRKKQSSRSFASKYMHFHCPAVPIIDSYAASALRKLVRWQPDLNVFAPPPGRDEEYCWFVMRFWRLYQGALAAGVQPTVKDLDYYLLCMAET